MSFQNNQVDLQAIYRKDIDGLRAIAILSVVLFHAFPKLLPGGFIGVDIFFVISGFLITGVILQHLNQDQFSFIDFYSRRIRRIFPALFVVLVAAYAYGWYHQMADEFAQLGKHWSCPYKTGHSAFATSRINSLGDFSLNPLWG